MAVSLLIVLPAAPASSGAGELDDTFGAGGKVVTDVAGENESAFRVHLRPNGKMVVSGCYGCFPTLTTDFVAVQYNSDGSIDSAFGDSGSTVVDFGREDPLSASVLQPDGKIVLVGSTTEPFNPEVRDFALTRLASDGKIDTTFGTGGKVTTDIGADDQPNDAVLQNDGKIVVGGFSNIAGRRFVLARYNADGSLDASFGSGGIVVTDVGGFDQIVRQVVVQPDGKIVAVGFDGADVVLARFTAAGSLDPTFGSAGIVKTDIAGAGRDLGFAAVLLENGRIVVGGLANNADFALLRYDEHGKLDDTFGTGGIVTTSFGHGQDIVYSLAVLATGQYLAVGEARAPERSFGLALYNTDGSLDAGFGTDGRLTTGFGDVSAVARHVSIQQDGKAVVAGVSAGTGQDFALARYILSETQGCTLTGTAANDHLVGTAGDDVICGLGGDDVLEGLGGNDVLIGGPGNDLLAGNSGDDELSGQAGDDTLFGGSGTDLLAGGGGADFLSGGDGDDELHGSDGPDELIGGADNDVLWGGPGADSLEGRAGNDTLRGGSGNDELAGNPGDDLLYGQAGDDTLLGGPGLDLLSGGGGNDVLRGGDDQDELHGREGQDTLVGGDGDDRLWGGDGHDLIEGRLGHDLLRGGNGHDTLAGNHGEDILYGGNGDDTLYGGPDTDECNGGSGSNSLVSCELAA